MIPITDVLKLAGSQSRGNAQSINILKTLLEIQAKLGFVPPASLPEIAAELGVTDAEVNGVLSFYPDLRTQAAGRHVIRVCLGEGCIANHCRQVLKELEKKLGIRLGESTRDGRFTLEKMYCAGNCGVGPTVMVDQDVHGRVAPTGVPKMLGEYQ
jgi:NADH:ubiquinone oxidoreductase subunit E